MFPMFFMFSIFSMFSKKLKDWLRLGWQDQVVICQICQRQSLHKRAAHSEYTQSFIRWLLGVFCVGVGGCTFCVGGQHWWCGDPGGRCSSGIPGKGWSISPDLGECARPPRPTLMWVGGGELWIFLKYFHNFFQMRNAACSVLWNDCNDCNLCQSGRQNDDKEPSTAK